MTEADIGSEELITVEIVGLPVDVQSQAQQQTDELARELTLVAEQLRQDGGSGELPVRFVELVAALSGRYSVFTAEQERQLTEAIAAGEHTIDLTYTLPVSAVVAAAHLGDILDEADDYCRSGQLLLTLATPPPLVTYRKWFLAQYTEQAAGHPPIAWVDYVAQAAPS
jgi:hypothetical protein